MSTPSTQSRPVVSMVVSPRTDAARRHLYEVLSDFVPQGTTVRVNTLSNGRTIVSGESDSHLEPVREYVLSECKIEADISEPQVIYLGTIRKHAAADGEFIYSFSAPRFHGKVRLRLEPLTPGSGYEFVSTVPAEAVPQELVEQVNLTIQESMRAGVMAGQEIVDLRAVLCDCSYDPKQSNASAFKIATSIAFKDAVRKAHPIVLEPIMSVEIAAPEEQLSVSTLIGDLRSRRGLIAGVVHEDDIVRLRAIVPMAEILGYASYLRERTQGRAEYSAQLLRYRPTLSEEEPGDDETGAPTIQPEGPDPASGGNEAGVLAIKPGGPKSKSRSVTVVPDPADLRADFRVR